MQLIDTSLLDKVSEEARKNTRLRMNFNYHANAGSPSQRLLNAIEPGSVLPVHRHRHTDETYILIRGRIRMFFYNQDGHITEDEVLDPLNGQFGVNIPAGQWHTLEVLEPGSVIFECKDGPYTPLSPEDCLII
ncbi:MAG: WbuC family cupin fold metalloprotein [Bacteroidota bacterium]|nr:WbuC family cupin fold metalloprotein [Bacteroidota bacterium]